MPNTRSGATMIREAIDDLIARQVAEALEARDAAMNLETLAEGNGGNGNGGNGRNENGGDGGNEGNGNGGRNKNENGNGNRGGNDYGNHNMNYGGFMPVSRECTFQDFLK
ncbi:hypothetical protein Tco_0680182 [Tanacetum coccineum]|uniref:Uncharacterized protein n=1 Tax=Tanacetum coccineum TaxID=301880 RepID=A0ABQ4XKX9_9ASTR